MGKLKSVLEWTNTLGHFLFRLVVSFILVQLMILLYLVNTVLIRAQYYPAPVQECVEEEAE
jgi:hypothetical protein